MPARTHSDNPEYLAEQLVTYIGNKRALLSFIERGVTQVQEELGKQRLRTFDVFSGSGVVSRFLKHCSSHVYANDMEPYASVLSSCYLENPTPGDLARLDSLYARLVASCRRRMARYLDGETRFKDPQKLPGFISELYAPKDLYGIRQGERCFYTPYNACYLDCMRQCIDALVPEQDRRFFIAPLLAEASVHANTGGVFKGFYKDSATGTGKFGGNGENALRRITGHIALPFPVFSAYRSRFTVFCEDANSLAASRRNPHVDLAYIDPPYNQHPYGSNYFMLNLLAAYERPSPEDMSPVSGIPRGWNRSPYNKRHLAEDSLSDLVQNLDAQFLLVSFNNEGFISRERMEALLSAVGTVQVLEEPYTAYRASRNLSARSARTREYLYIVRKR